MDRREPGKEGQNSVLGRGRVHARSGAKKERERVREREKSAMFL
jgi:hypothetical protein